MDVKVIATTHIGHEAEKVKYDDFSGKMVGLTNTSDNLKTLMYEDSEKALRRSFLAKEENNIEYFKHESFTLYFEGLPKIVSMLIDGEKSWVKSEKAGRFNEAYLSKDEEIIYSKWIELFKNKINKKYKESGKVCTDKMCQNLAEEYAIYLKSVFSPITVCYTATYADFNRVIALFENYIAKNKENDFENKLSSALIEFTLKMKDLPYYDKELASSKANLALFANSNIEEYYGDVYATSYKCSMVCLAELLNNKNVTNKAKLIEGEYFVPSIIAENKDLGELWSSDLVALGNYPMATIVEVNEMSTLDEFISRMNGINNPNDIAEVKECTKEIFKKYEYSLRLKIHSRAEELMSLNK